MPTPRAVVGLLFVAGALVRIALLGRIPEVHYDEAVNGLMARHILRGEFPVFYWGQDYAGTLAAFLMAVPFALVDASVTTLRLVPLGFSLLLMALTYRLATLVYDGPTGRLALLYVGLPPLALLYFGVTAKDPYAEIPLLGLLLVLLAVRLAKTEGVDRRRAFVLGLVGGVAWWTQLLLVSYLLAVGVFVVCRRRPWLLREGGAGLAGFALGSLPLWCYNLVQPGWTLGLIRRARAAEVGENLVQIVRGDLPFLLGASAPWPSPTANSLIALTILLVYLPAGGLVLGEALRGLWRRRPLSAGGLVGLAVPAVLLLDAASGYQSAGGPKYLVPLYAVLPVLLAHYTVAVKRTLGAGLAVLVALAVVGLGVQEHLRDHLDSFRAGYLEEQSRPPTRALIEFLRAQGISHAYAHFRISLKLAFDTREEILATDWFGFRTPGYLETVERADRVALVAHRRLQLPNPDMLEENVRALGGAFRRHEVDGFVVFYDFRPPPPARRIPARAWVGRGMPSADGSPLAYDRDGVTWWGSGEPQRPGLAYELDLGRVHRVTRVSLHPGPVLEGAPRGFAVAVSADGRAWREVARVAEVLAGLHWAGAQPRLDRSGRVQAGFPPADARYVRVTQTGGDRHFWWSIGEVFLDEEGPPVADRSPGAAALDEGRRLEAAARWEYLGASPVALAAWRWRWGVDWDGVLGAYERALRADPELEEAHHRLAVVGARLEIPAPGDPGRAPALGRVGAWRTAAREYDTMLRDSAASLQRSAGWEARLRLARQVGDAEGARKAEAVLRARFTPPITSGLTFSRQLKLLGLGLTPARAVPGQEVRLAAYWQALRPVAEEYDAVLTFRAPSGTRFEAAPLRIGGALPPQEWVPGETVRDDVTVRVPAGLAAGEYEVHLRVRGSLSGRLRVWRYGLPTWAREARVGSLGVEARQ